LPRGYYGERLDDRALSRLPYYPGYEWRRMGGDIVLIVVGTGVVYEVLEGVLY
jgi:Ni/Co efflux regulator RcnB